MSRWLAYIILLVIVISLWQYFGTANNTVKILISSPALCVQYFRDNTGLILGATLVTGLESFVRFDPGDINRFYANDYLFPTSGLF